MGSKFYFYENVTGCYFNETAGGGGGGGGGVIRLPACRTELMGEIRAFDGSREREQDPDAVCPSLWQEVREQTPISKAPQHSVTQWAVKMLIQHTHTHTHTDTHTDTHTQVMQNADSRLLVGSNSCSGHCAPGEAGACWIFHYSLIYCLTNPVITEPEPSSHTYTQTRTHTHTQETHTGSSGCQSGCQAWQIGLFDPGLLNKRGESHE